MIQNGEEIIVRAFFYTFLEYFKLYLNLFVSNPVGAGDQA